MTSRDATARASRCPTVRCSRSAPCPAGLVACHGERPGRRRDALVLRARDRIGRRRTHGTAVLTRYATAAGPRGSKSLACSTPPRPFASCGRGAARAGHRPSVRRESRPGHRLRAGQRSRHTRRRGGRRGRPRARAGPRQQHVAEPTTLAAHGAGALASVYRQTRSSVSKVRPRPCIRLARPIHPCKTRSCDVPPPERRRGPCRPPPPRAPTSRCCP